MATARRKLAAVPTKRAPAKPMTLRDATERSERATLVVLRNMITAQLDALSKIQDQKASTAASFAAVMKQFREVDSAIRAIDVKARQERGEDGMADPSDGWDDSSI